MMKRNLMAIMLVIMLGLPFLGATPVEGQTSPHRPVAELFVFVGCIYCPYAEEALPNVMSNTDATVLVYHVWSDRAGWDTPEGEALASQYGVTGAPAMVVDGVDVIRGADPMGYGQGHFTESCEDGYVLGIDSRPETSQASLVSSIERNENSYTINATVSLDTLFEDGLAVGMVIYETSAIFDGVVYLNVVREVLEPQQVLTPGQHTYSRTVDAPSRTQDGNNLAAAIFLYDTDTGERYQSTTSFISTPASVVQDDEPEGGTVVLNTFLILLVVLLVAAVVLRWRKV